MKILYILKHNPWGIGGGCYATKNYLEIFSELFKNIQIDVLICKEYYNKEAAQRFHNCRFIPVAPRNKVQKYLTPITRILHRHHKIGKTLIENNNYNFCIFDHSSIAGSLVNICIKKKTKTIVINHNCEIEYFKDNNNKIHNLLLLPAVKANEHRSYIKCNYNIFLTEEDSITFNSYYGKSLSKIIIGGIPLKTSELIISNNGPFNINCPRIVISGTMGNIQNLDGIYYFLDELYYKLPKNVQIIMTGKNPPNKLFEKIKDYSNIKIIPNPTNILDIVKDCDIFLCATRLGSGMKLRVLDGIKCSLPILAHKISARGYHNFEKKGFLYSFENENEFIEDFYKIVDLIKNNKDLKKEIREYSLSISFEKKIEMFKTIFLDNK